MQDKFNRVCIITCSDTYEKIRADFVYKYLRSQGVDVVVHTTDFLHIQKCKRNDKKENYIMHETLPYKKNLSYARIHSHAKLAKEIFESIDGENFDLIWCIVPPNSVTKEAARFKQKNPNTKLVFDIIDLWPESMPLAKLMKTPPVLYWKGLRDKYLNKADLIVTECNLFKTRLPKTISEDKFRNLYLGRADAAGRVTELDSNEKGISLCYLGSINNIIDIPVMVEIAEAFSKLIKTTIHIVGDGEKRQELISALEATGAEVKYHGLVYDIEEKRKIFSKCHFGLNIMKSSVVVGLTMKSMDYFEFGLPVINNIHGDTWDFIEKEKLGTNLEGDYAAKAVDLSKDVNMRQRTRDFYLANLSETAVNACLEKILEDI